MAEEKRKYARPPKKKEMGGGKYLNDYDALKALYLDGPDYDWKPFCDRHNYHALSLRALMVKAGILFTEWKKEWLKRQAQIQDEELGPEILSLRKIVSLQRIKFVKDWTGRTAYMKTMLDAMLKRHGDDLQHDINNTLAIQAGKAQRRFRLEADELTNLAGAAQRLQEIETRALLLTGDKTQHAVITAGGEIEHREGPAELEAPDMRVVTMGQSGLSAAETAKLLSQWFDQAEKKDEKKEEPGGQTNNG